MKSKTRFSLSSTISYAGMEYCNAHFNAFLLSLPSGKLNNIILS